MSSGYIIVPLPSFGLFGVPEEFIKRIQSVIEDCQPRLIVIENSSLWNRHMQNIDLNVPVVEVGELHLRSMNDPSGTEPGMEPFLSCETAFIQYTSGSTGNPKGVIITHQNLASNLYYMGTVSHINPAKDSLLSWLPLYHDMGLVGNLLFPLYWNIPSYVFTPLSFVTRPVSWLKAMHHFKATYSVAPTFAYTIAHKKIHDRELEGIDLSSWRLAFIGAEPIDSETAKGFIQKFAKYKFKSSAFYPVYGMAEATLALAFPPCGRDPQYDTIDRKKIAEEKRAISVPHPATPPHSLSPSVTLSLQPEAITFVSVGQVLPDHTLRIIDPETCLDLPERCIGEIIVSGPSVSPYYYSNKQFKQERRSELRTGDLGYFANGELYIVGRLKDLIIIAGQNFIPADIEGQLAKIKGLRTGRIVAFSTPNSEGTESLYIMAEIKPKHWRTQNEIRTKIANIVNEKFGIKVAQIIFKTPGTLPKTSSGKVKRSACRDEYLTKEPKLNVSFLEIFQYKLKSIWHRILLLYSDTSS